MSLCRLDLNIVPVEKKDSGKIHVCIDFRDLNKATPKDEYPMPIADMLINEASGHRVISFLDGNADYNQIFIAEEDTSKTAFRCPDFVGLFEWVVMTFGLKNTGATYQRAMNLIFRDWLGVILEVYIDGIVIQSSSLNHHSADLIKLLKEYIDCFAWEYSKMPGLSYDLVEHRLSIKAGFKPYKQPARRFNPSIYDRIKEEINRLLDASFIRSCRYADWISNIVPIEKKDSGKIRVAIDFRDLNKATPKNEYSMPIADMLINETSRHRVISFLNRTAGYN